MADRFTAQKQAYARLIINAGVNLRKGQGVYIQAELGHRDFVRLLTKEAYAAGAKMVMATYRRSGGRVNMRITAVTGAMTPPAR